MATDGSNLGDVELVDMSGSASSPILVILEGNILDRNREKMEECVYGPHFVEKKGERSTCWQLMKKLFATAKVGGVEIGELLRALIIQWIELILVIIIQEKTKRFVVCVTFTEISK
jgi:hypothetical protein